jgi:16S rRNA (guanine527-N7)-methyltransferase
MALWDDIFTRCQSAGIPLSMEAAEKLFQFHLLLTDWNKRMDLTAVLEESEMVDRHYVDSLTPLKTDRLFPKGASVIDVGSGAGFPGIPLAIARPDIHVTLLDAQQKRVRFLQEAAAQLNLINVSAIHGRAEDTAHQLEFRESFSLALARAVASLPTLLELLLPFVRIGGRALCWKGPAVTSFAPALLKLAMIFALVVPRTMESSTSTIRFPSTFALRGFSFNRTAFSLWDCVGKIKLRPIYLFFTKPDTRGNPLTPAYPIAASSPLSGTPQTTSAMTGCSSANIFPILYLAFKRLSLSREKNLD